MTEDRDQLEDFGRRTGTALRDHAEDADAATRSRLARARAQALDAAARPRRWLTLRHLAPAGAVAGAALVALLLVVGRDTVPDALADPAAQALFDLELLADADALDLAEEGDLEFIEWAAAMAELEGAGG